MAIGILARPRIISPNYVNSPRVSYITQLHPLEQQMFHDWVKQNNVPYDPSPYADYDMPGFWRAMSQGDPRAASSVNPVDNRIHYPDVWKTPYHDTFSAESMYSTNPTDPVWAPQAPFSNHQMLLQFVQPIFKE